MPEAIIIHGEATDEQVSWAHRYIISVYRERHPQQQQVQEGHGDAENQEAVPLVVREVHPA